MGSAESAKYDQILDSIMVGPVPVGINRFIFETDPPRSDLIPIHEIKGVTVLLLICSYADQEFIRIGYYVDNDYDEIHKETLELDAPVKIEMLKRNILEDKPRVTRFNIIWDATKLAQSKTQGDTFEVPEELLAIKEPTNFEEDPTLDQEDEDEDEEDEEDEDMDENEMDEEIEEEEVSEEDLDVSSEEENEEYSTECELVEELMSENDFSVNTQQHVATMDTVD